jgi:hypothetical protein
MEKFDTQIPVRYGIMTFVAVFVIGMLMYVFYESMFKNLMMFGALQLSTLLLVLFFGIWSGITYRKEHGGVISFAHAFGAIYIVFVCHIVSFNACTQLINKVIDKQYATKASQLLKEKVSDQMEKANMTDEQIKARTDGMGPEKFNPPMADVLKAMAGWLAGYSVVAVIIALFIKRGSADMIVSETPPHPIRTI